MDQICLTSHRLSTGTHRLKRRTPWPLPSCHPQCCGRPWLIRCWARICCGSWMHAPVQTLCPVHRDSYQAVGRRGIGKNSRRSGNAWSFIWGQFYDQVGGFWGTHGSTFCLFISFHVLGRVGMRQSDEAWSGYISENLMKLLVFQEVTIYNIYYIILYYIILYYIILYHIILYYIICYFIILYYYTFLFYIVLKYIILYYIILYYIILYYIIL